MPTRTPKRKPKSSLKTVDCYGCASGAVNSALVVLGSLVLYGALFGAIYYLVSP